MSETKTHLKRLIRIAGATDDVLVSLQIVSDLGYAWGPVIDHFTPLMQLGVKKDPSLVGKLRATFLKVTFEMQKSSASVKTKLFSCPRLWRHQSCE